MAKKVEKPEVFNMVSLSRSNSGVFTASWQVGREVYSLESDLAPHKDLTAKIDKVVTFLAKYYDMPVDGLGFKKVSMNEYEKEEGAYSIAINCSYTHPEGEQVTPLKTAAIQTHNAVYGFEKNLLKAVKDLSKEVEAYVFEKKSSQKTLDLNAA